ncbi:WhiB family transcriptional regulator [Streptomyces sp. NPDC094468]|uniref:WhiB family transcriptional regulator n=1 Tax=Streptomyces sp. NPDC094468 TaxID=3366066 RepID=UPI003828D35B
MAGTHWIDNAACGDSNPDDLFAQMAQQKQAKAICDACAVRIECLAEALDSRIEFGVWGGMTERERKALLNRRPDVTSWRTVLDQAHEAFKQSRVG